MERIDAFYGRNSSDEQVEKGTIQAQVEFGRKYFDLHDIRDYEMYLDEGVSGAKALADRNDSARMLEDVKQGKIKTVYVYRLDRLARSVKHTLDTYEYLEKYGVRLVSMTEAFDTGTPTGKFFMTLLASIAALERETILERTQMGKDRNAKQGNWVSGAPPFGYRVKDKKLIIYDPEAEIVREIFKLYADGMNMLELSKYLNAKNIPTPATSKGTKSSGRWIAGKLSRILNNTVYIGQLDYLKNTKKKKEIIKVVTPEIIDREMFKAVQRQIAENRDRPEGKKGRVYPLHGLIFCGHCGRALAGSSGDSTKGRVYYRCLGTVDHGEGKRCDAKLIRATDVENSVWEDVKEIFKHPEQFTQFINKALEENKEASPRNDVELAEVELKIEDKQKSRERIIGFITRNIISDVEAVKELKSLAEDIDALEKRRDFLFEKQSETKTMESEVLNAQLVIETVKGRLDDLTQEDKIRIMRRFVKRVDVYTITDENGRRGNEVKPTYRISCMGLGDSWNTGYSSWNEKPA